MKKKKRKVFESNKRVDKIDCKRISMHRYVFNKADIGHEGIGTPNYAKKKHAKKRNHRRKKQQLNVYYAKYSKVKREV